MPPVVNMTHQFNTKLSRGDERRFIAWANSNGKMGDLFDYDLRGAWKSGVTATEGHLPDTYKKPNHPTFSTESIYSTPNNLGGTWDSTFAGWSFTPSETNLQYRSYDDLQKYLTEKDPTAKLGFPKRLGGK